MENGNLQEIMNTNFNVDDYSIFFSAAFKDLIDLVGEDSDTFIELFYNRKEEFTDFNTIASNLYATGDNILVVGDAGTGKSNFIYRLFYETKMLERCRLYPMIIDFRKIATSDKLIGMKLMFVEEMLKYFVNVGFVLNPIGGTISIENIDNNLHLIQSKLKQLVTENKKTKHPLIFVDDLDYAEKDDLFDVLSFLMPFARTPNISLLICVRPPLYNVLLNNDSTFAILFAHTPKHIELRSMDLHSIIAMRLAPILILNKVEEHTNIFENVWWRIKRLQNGTTRKYRAILKKVGVKNLDDLTQIEYPFTDGYINFIKKVSLGDLREIFSITIKSLVFILNNYHKLEKINEHGEKRIVISEKHIIDLFSEEQSAYRLFNLHDIKNLKENSLYFNILEAIYICQDNLNPEFMSKLKLFGHTNEKQINDALLEMSFKRHRLLLPHNFEYSKDILGKAVRYTITTKGVYYIQVISEWEDYIKKYGKSKESIIKNNMSYEKL